MGAMKNYVMGVCDAHPKEMYDLYDLLCDFEFAERAVNLALVECFGGDTYPTEDIGEIEDEIIEILEEEKEVSHYGRTQRKPADHPRGTVPA